MAMTASLWLVSTMGRAAGALTIILLPSLLGACSGISRMAHTELDRGEFLEFDVGADALAAATLKALRESDLSLEDDQSLPDGRRMILATGGFHSMRLIIAPNGAAQSTMLMANVRGAFPREPLVFRRLVLWYLQLELLGAAS